MVSRPQAVVFDLGKVLLDFDYRRAARNLRQHCELEEDAIAAVLNQSPLLHRYETGLLSTEEFFEEVRRAARFRRGLTEFEPLFADIFTPVPEMIRLNERLRQLGVPTFIFSNTNDIAVRHIRERYEFFANFAGHVYSFEQRSMKPDPAIYAVVEERAGCRGSQLLYIDDRPENIDQGAAREWRTVLHKDPGETIPRVERCFA